MRELKFRAWNPVDKIMGKAFTIGQFCGAYPMSDNIDTEGIIYMQFTGIYDREKTPIYEADIVRWDDGSNGRYWRVAECFYDTEEALFAYRIIKTINCHLDKGYVFGGNFMYRDGRNLEVIGNIYSNPELL